jgi:hypothetical protein
VFEEAACFADDYPKFKLDRFKMRVDPLATNCFQGAEQPIAPLTISLNFGHSKLSKLVKLGSGGCLTILMVRLRQTQICIRLNM